MRNSCLVCEDVLWCAAGGMAGGFFATSIGDKHPFGIEGWRFAFFLIASVSIFTGILTAVMASDPRMVGLSQLLWPVQGKAAPVLVALCW